MTSLSAADLVGQISAASTVLAGLEHVDATTVAAVAAAQRQRLESSLRAARGFSLQDMASLTTAISVSSFPLAHRQALLMVMAQLSSLSPASSADSKFQKVESLMNYLPTSAVAKAGTPEFSKALLHFSLRLGLRKPSEPTFKELSFLALVGADGVEKALSFSSETRSGMLESTKHWFRKAAERMPAASPWLAVLPHSPRDLQTLHAEHWQQLYSADPLKTLDIEPVQLEMLRAGTRCRKPKHGRACWSMSAGSSSSTNAPVTWGDLRHLMSGMTNPHNDGMKVTFLQPSGAAPSSSPLTRSLLARQASSQLLPLPALQSPASASPPSASTPQQPHAVPTAHAPQQLTSIAGSELAKEQQATQAAAKAKISVEETLNEIALAMAEKAEKAKARQAVKKRPAACVDRAKDSGEGKHV